MMPVTIRVDLSSDFFLNREKADLKVLCKSPQKEFKINNKTGSAIFKELSIFSFII